MRRLRVIALLFLLPLLSGCFGQGGKALDSQGLAPVLDEFKKLDEASPPDIDSKLSTLQKDVEDAAARKTRDSAARSDLDRKRLLIGYCWERKDDLKEAIEGVGETPGARGGYGEASRGDYASVALFRIAQVAEYEAARAEAQSRDLNSDSIHRQAAAAAAKDLHKQAIRALERAAMFPVKSRVLVRQPPVASEPLQSWQDGPIRHEAYVRLDKYYRQRGTYKVFSQLVRICGGGPTTDGGPKRSFPYILAIVLIAVLAKLITTPLSAAQFRSMRALQAVQPELKKIQADYKNDKAQLAKAQMELFKKHKVSPASSCLPMLIQFPILIWVYYAIRYYVFQFEGVRFLYIPSLADPDVIAVAEMLWPGPLLVLYGVSMFFSQKLLSQPGASPEQQQQQKMMAYMMPVILLFILKGLPAAFILYWLLQNILMTGHQYLIMRPHRQADAAAAAVAARSPAPPPREGIRAYLKPRGDASSETADQTAQSGDKQQKSGPGSSGAQAAPGPRTSAAGARESRKPSQGRRYPKQKRKGGKRRG